MKRDLGCLRVSYDSLRIVQKYPGPEGKLAGLRSNFVATCHFNLHVTPFKFGDQIQLGTHGLTRAEGICARNVVSEL